MKNSLFHFTSLLMWFAYYIFTEIRLEGTEDLSDWEIIYQQDFEDIELGKLPADFFVMDGNFSVQQRDGKRCLVLPGRPVGDYGLLFGPRLTNHFTELKLSFFATSQGRRFPSLEMGIGGIRGVRLRIDGALARARINWRDLTENQTSVKWDSVKWNFLILRIEQDSHNFITDCLFKLWSKDSHQPQNWSSASFASVQSLKGKCALWGYPYAGTEMLWDTIKIRIPSSN